tara:strand:+ start:1129 stop:1620 length:492 start_codon:yes stop_codon:yes gene_type:complete
MKVEHFKKQHSEILQIFSNIQEKISSGTSQESISDVVFLLTSLSDKLDNHLKIEDKYLYPSLKKEDQPDLVRFIANQFIDEMGKVYSDFKEFEKKWPKENILNNPSFFINETNNLFLAVKERVEKEEKILFVLLENNKILEYFSQLLHDPANSFSMTQNQTDS